MRKLTWSAVGFALAFVGCAAREEDSTDSATKSARTECNSDDCCASLSRTAMLTQGAKASENANPVALKTIKFEAFKKDIQAHHGKVVCAYQWSEDSAASKKNLPLLLDLQRKLGKDGVVFLTVSNDAAKASKKTLLALQAAKCDLVNYLQDENDTAEGWAKTFGCCGFPGLVVFDRAGKKAATIEVTELPFEAQAIESALVKVLANK